MKLKSGDKVMYDGQMYVVANVSASLVPSYHLVDENGEPHPDGPFTKSQTQGWPVV